MKSDYEFIEEIGRGGQAITWKALRRETGDLVAIRVLKFAAVKEWKTVQLFERESHTLQSLDHPDVPDYIDAFTEEADGALSLYLVQEFVEGQSLQDALFDEGRRSSTQARQDLTQLLNVLAYLHNRVPPVIHRDIKPSNIIRRPDGRVCLIDFGAVQLDHGASMASTVIGTPGYMPMEQMIGRANPRSDLYSLGATVAHLWTGRDPSRMGLDGARLDIRSLASTDDPGLLAVLEKLTEPDAGKRFGSAEEALAALQVEVKASEHTPGDDPHALPPLPDPLSGEDRAQIETKKLGGVDASWSKMLFGGFKVAPRARETGAITAEPKVKAAEHLGFEFLGRQTRFNKVSQATREVWTSPDGQVYLIHSSDQPKTKEGGGPVSLISFLEDGRIVTTSPNGSGGLKGHRWELKSSGDLVADHRSHLSHLSDALGQTRTLRGLDMDAVMALNDHTWFGLPERIESEPKKPLTLFAKILIALGIIALVVPLGVTFAIIMPIVLLAQLYGSHRAWTGWKDEVAQGLTMAPSPSKWTLPEFAESHTAKIVSAVEVQATHQ